MATTRLSNKDKYFHWEKSMFDDYYHSWDDEYYDPHYHRFNNRIGHYSDYDYYEDYYYRFGDYVQDEDGYQIFADGNQIRDRKINRILDIDQPPKIKDIWPNE